VFENATEGQVVMPFYIICDVSASMSGDMAAMNAGVTDLCKEIGQDPVADDLTMLSIISFGSAARTVVPLNFPTAVEMQPLTCGGATNYTAAFQEFHRAFQADRARLKSEGKRVFRPCIFFITDGEPTSGDHLQVFRQLLGYDPNNKQGNPAYPYVTPFGFRAATEMTMKSLAYPDFGEKRGRYFLAKQGSSIPEMLKAMIGMIANSVLASSNSATTGTVQFVQPKPDPGSPLEGDFV
jgi:uncharacterized protein YegL